VTILDRVFPPSECDDAVGDRWAKSGTTLLGLWLIGLVTHVVGHFQKGLIQFLS
jgi:hypothetical protein